eukprot:4284-Heterococcus_DN1.PRE.2
MVCTQRYLCTNSAVLLKACSAHSCKFGRCCKLTTAALCDNAVIRVVWQGNIQLAETIVVGNGTSLTVAGDSAKTAVIGGGIKIQLFDVWRKLNLMNVTLSNGNTAFLGAAIYSRANTEVIISGSVFSGHRASYGGAILSDCNSSLTITDCQFSNNKCSRSGGAVYSEVNSMLSVFRAHFDGNTAATGAGAIYAGNNSLCTISSNSTFTNNNASNGAAVYSGFNSTLAISKCELSSNNGSMGTMFSGGNSCEISDNNSNSSGNIYIESESVLIISASNRNSAKKIGGVIYIADSATATITTSIFKNNTGEFGAAVYSDSNSALAISEFGAAVYSNSTNTLNIADCEFSDNNGTAGTVYSGENSILAVFNTHFGNSKFTNNNADRGGAVFGGREANIAISNSHFSFNNASSYGGGLYASSNCNLVTSNSTFHANSAVDGGGIKAYGNITFTDCQFSDHTAQFGAAVLVQTNLTATISNCSFTNNSASTTAGALYTGDLCAVTVTDCDFSNNTATNYAGSTYVYSKSTVNTTATSFTGGSAAVGGALVVVTESSVTSRDVHMRSNTVVNGGAIAIQAQLYVYNSSFINNTAMSRGGILGGETQSSVEMQNSTMNANSCQVLHSCLLTSNTAGLNGGAVYTDYGAVGSMKNCLVSGNTAQQSGGGWFGFGKDQVLKLNATQITNNSAACCFASVYGSKLTSNATSTLTCADTDSGENRACDPGTDCSTIGTSLATPSLVAGYWRASTTSTDVRPCWFADACMTNYENGSESTSSTSTSSKTIGATVSVSTTMSSSSSITLLFQESDDCNDTTATSTTILASIARVDDATYCAQGYKGPFGAKSYSNSIGYECTRCKSGTKAAMYTGLALLLLAITLFIWFMTLELLGLGDGQDAASTTSAFGCMNKLASLPWVKLRTSIVAFQIITQYISITGLPLPNIYRCLTQIDFYQKLLLTTLGPCAVAAALAATYATVRQKNKVQAVPAYTSQHIVVPARTSKLQKAFAKHYLVFLAMTFLIHSTVSTTVFQHLHVIP